MVPPPKDMDFWQLCWIKAAPGKSDVTFHVIDFLPYVVQVGFQNPTEGELAEEGGVGVFRHR